MKWTIALWSLGAVLVVGACGDSGGTPGDEDGAATPITGESDSANAGGVGGGGEADATVSNDDDPADATTGPDPEDDAGTGSDEDDAGPIEDVGGQPVEDAVASEDVAASPDTMGSGDVTDTGPGPDDTVDTPEDDATTIVDPPEGDDLTTTVELGTVDIVDGTSAALTAVVPEGAVSLSITASGMPGVMLGVHGLESPSGETMAMANWFESSSNFAGPTLCLICPNRVAPAEGAAAALVPITPLVALEPGEWTFQIAGFTVGGGFTPSINDASGVADVRVTYKLAPEGLPEEAVLDLNLFFTGGDGLTAATAPTDPRIVDALDDMAALYGQVGIALGEIRYADLDSAYQVIEGMQGAGNDFQMAASLTADAEPGVNLIFVREIYDGGFGGGFGVILGVSGGIPGPIGLQGTERSAVFVATDLPPQADNDDLGLTMAHEVGHYLGLFHSSEIPFFDIHDPLPDTAEHDESNLMYFDGSSAGVLLSPGQGTVMRSNPWLRHPGEEGSR